MKLFNLIAVLMAVTLLVPPVSAQETSIRDETILVEDQTFRYLTSGTSGPTLVLIHGWPQTADAFRHVFPMMADDYTLYAPDLSGIGGTTARDRDWSKEALAGDIRAFVEALNLEQPIVVGHDIGGMVAYAYARQFPDDLSGLVVADVPIPGIAPWDWVASSSNAWHFDFHGQADLAEALVMGQQADYFRYFIDQTAKNGSAILDSEVAVFAEAYGTMEQLAAGFELYRAFDADVEFFQSQTGDFDLPMLLIGAETSMAGALDIMADDLREAGAANLEVSAVEDSGHWVFEEQPEATAAMITAFAERIVNQ